LGGTAWAATGDAANGDTGSDNSVRLQEIVVTGTLIRNVAPVGTQLISISPIDISASGAQTASQLLATMPQVGGYFNTLPQVSANVYQQQVLKPNLRNLPESNVQSGASTLILLDGHRIAGAGVTQDAPDIDVIPPSLIERVEIMPDGGSATYGSDAVGGVINFITRRHFNGIESDARYGFAKDYKTFDASITAGHDFGKISAYVSYSYARNDPIYNRDRSYYKDLDWTTGVFAGRQCANPNIQVGNDSYAVPGLQPGTFNACNQGANATLYPENQRHSFFAGLDSDLSDSVSFDLHGYYTLKSSTIGGGSGGVTVTVPPSNPFYENLAGTPDAGKTQNVSFNFAPLYGPGWASSLDKIEEWGVTPTLRVDLGAKWQVRTTLNYGGSKTTYDQRTANTALLTQYASGTTPATAIDPYDIAATPGLAANLLNWHYAGLGETRLLDPTVIADGPVVALPGGEVHAAAGIEYSSNRFKSRLTQATTYGGESALPISSYTQNDKSAFAELDIPLVGEGNGHLLLRSLEFDASGRFDDYNDFGHTVNPKLALTYEPVDWIKVRGHWGRAFNAPTPVDELGALNNQLVPFPFPAVVPPGSIPPAGSFTLAVLGSTNHLRPQTAKIYSFGTDVSPPVLPGLTVSGTYYYITYDGLLGNPPVFNPSLFIPYYKSFYTLNPTAAQIQAFGALAPGGAATVVPFLAPGGPPVYELIDFRQTNLGDAKVGGLDFSLRYTHPTGFGSIDGQVAGNYQIEQALNAGPGTPFVNQLQLGESRLAMSAMLGADIHNFRAQATVYHTGGYPVTPSATLHQSSVGSFDVVNLFFSYTSSSDSGWSKDLKGTLGIYNVADRSPPLYMQDGGAISGGSAGYTNGMTVGRYFQVGLSKKFW